MLIDSKPHDVLESLSERNRRMDARRPVFYRLDVTDGSDGLVGYLVDLTTGGMRVRCNPEVDIEGLERLRILFPRWMRIGEGLTVTGHFVWAKPARDGCVECGFAFNHQKSRITEVLEILIEHIAAAAFEDKLL